MPGRKSNRSKNGAKEVLSGPASSKEAFYDDDPTVGGDGRITNFPPKYHDISSRWVILVLRANWTAGMRYDWYPRVFTSKGLRLDWENKGTAGKELVDNVWRYQVAFGNRQLHGAEGVQFKDVLDREAIRGTEITLGDPANDQKPPSKANTRKYLAKAATASSESPSQHVIQRRQTRKRKSSISSVDTFASSPSKDKATEPKQTLQTPEVRSSRSAQPSHTTVPVPTGPSAPGLSRPSAPGPTRTSAPLPPRPSAPGPSHYSDPGQNRFTVSHPNNIPGPNRPIHPPPEQPGQRNIEGWIYISDSEKEQQTNLSLKEKLEQQTTLAKKGLDALSTIATICKTGQDPALHQVGTEYRALYKSLAAEHNKLLKNATRPRPFHHRSKAWQADGLTRGAGVRDDSRSYQRPLPPRRRRGY